MSYRVPSCAFPCALLLLGLSAVLPSAARAGTVGEPSPDEAMSPAGGTPPAAALAQMQARDRFAPPAGELAAWQAFASAVAADPTANVALRGAADAGLAMAYFYAKQHEDGAAAGRSAIAAIDTVGSEAGRDAPPDWQVEALAYTALNLIELKDGDAAQALVDRAQAIATSPAQRALVHNARAGLSFSRDDLPMAERHYCAARDLGLGDPDADPAMVVTNAGSCAVTKFFLDRPDTMEATNLAADFAARRLPPDHPRQGLVLNNGYGVLVALGRDVDAEPLVRRHLDLERRLHADTNGGAVDDVFDPLSMLGRILARRGRLEEAEAITAAAADMAAAMDTGGQPYKPGGALASLARVQAERGRLEAAHATARSAVAKLQADLEPGDANIGSGLLVLADILDLQGRSAEALAPAHEGLAILESKLPAGHRDILSARLLLARIMGADEQTMDGTLSLAWPTMRELRNKLFDLNLRQSQRVALAQAGRAGFENYLEAMLRIGVVDGALEAAQLILLSDLAAGNARIALGEEARQAGFHDELARLADLRSVERAALEQHGDALFGSDDEHPELAAARRAVSQQMRRMGRAFPAYMDLLLPTVAAQTLLQARLKPGEQAVFPIALPTGTVTLLVDRFGISVGRSDVGRAQVHALARRVRASSERLGAFDYAAAHELYRAAFPAQLDEALSRGDTLIFPAAGYLAAISPAALVTTSGVGTDGAGARWLVDSHAIRVSSSLSRVAAGGEGEAKYNRLLGIADPVIASDERLRDLPPLPGARRELDALVAALDDPSLGRILTGQDATHAALLEAGGKGLDLLAFATHGLVAGEVPGLAQPALLLAPGEGDDTGLLTAGEIARLGIDANWVLLSACNTGSGSVAGAPAFSGMAQAFISAGARALLLSHWRVRDDAAARLSAGSVRGWRAGGTRAKALQAAQIALRDDTSVPDAAHPAIWAPFILIED